MKRFSAIVFLFFLSASAATAQRFSIQNFRPEEYGGGTQNWDMGAIGNKCVLVANNRGLLVYDSDEWNTYPVANNSIVRTVFFDEKDDRIYAGASDEIGFFAPEEAGRGLPYRSLVSLLPPGSRSFGEVWDVCRAGGDIVFTAKTVLMVYTPRTGKMKVVRCPERTESSALIEGRLVVACKNGVYELRGGGLARLAGTEAVAGMTVKAVVRQGKDMVFVTATDGLFRYDGEKTVPWRLDISDFIIQNQVFCAAAGGGLLALGTVRGGLVVKDLGSGETSYVNMASGLHNNTVLSVRFDALGNIWAGLDDGISYVVLDTPYMSLLGYNNHIGTGYVTHLSGGRLYLGTNQGLYALPYPGEESPVRPAPEKVGGVGGQIWCTGEAGGVMLCGADGGMYRIDGMRARRIAGLEGTWAFTALKNHPDCVLAADYSGLVILRREGDTYRFSHRVKGFSQTSNSLIEDSDGSIWISHWQKGVYRLILSADLGSVARTELYDRNNGLPSNDDNKIARIGGRIVISSAGGFFVRSAATGRLERAAGLPRVTAGVPTALLETPRGGIWAFRDGFLALARREKNGAYAADSLTFSGLAASLHMDLGAFNPLDSGRTIFNTNNGFVIAFNGRRFQPAAAEVTIRRIRSINETDTTVFRDRIRAERGLVTVPHDRNSLRIEFVMPEYRKKGAVSYECFLEKYDEDWSRASTATYKEYTHLPRGTYVFRVRARNLITGETSRTSIRIRVLPAWYETAAARLAYVLLAAVLLWGVFRLIKSRAERELRRVRKEQEYRLREQEARFAAEKEKRDKEILVLKNEQLGVELKHKSGEMADTTINLIRKNDMLHTIDAQMEELSDQVRKNADGGSVIRKISDIRRDIKLHMNDDGNWEKFEENFNLVYDDFMTKLLRRFPGLKKNERKLCAYLRMGLSSKEMASLLNTSVRSVETARYRLRRKFPIEAGASLRDFLGMIAGDGEKEEEEENGG